MRHAFVALAAATVSTAAFAQSSIAPTGSRIPVPQVDSKTQAADVKFTDERNDRLTVPVSLAGAGPFQFIVDTGADRSVISSELAARLRLPRGSAASMHSVTGVTDVATVSIARLEWTGKPVKVVDVPVLESAHIGADGMLGTDSLRSQRVTFDFSAGKLTVVPSGVREARDEPGTIVVNASRKGGRLVVTDAEADGKRLAVVIDTGSQVTIGNDALRRQMLRDGVHATTAAVELESVTGEKIMGSYLFLPELTIGGASLKNLAVVFADAHTFKRLNMEKRPALLLGMNAIRAFKKVSIDFAARKFKVVLPETGQRQVLLAAM
jgi:predicted aspartyl protease